VASLPAAYKRMAAEVYWSIRGTGASSVKEYMALYYPAERRVGQSYRDLWMAADSVDTTLHMAYIAYGYAGVQAALASDDRVENWLSRLAAQVAFNRSGDPAMLMDIQSGKPPGDSDIAPMWAITGARETARSAYVARQRARAGGGQGDGAAAAELTVTGDDTPGDTFRRRTRPPRPKKEAPGPAAKGGGGKAPHA
jgi:hypothetical protein